MLEKSEFDKIGVNVIRPFKHNDRWMFERDGRKYDMAPAGIMDVVLSPLVVGVDKLIVLGCQMRGIKNSENGFSLLFSEEYFPNADVKFILKESKASGWIYSIEELNLTGLMPGQCAWICPYMIMYYPEPPKNLYLKIENG